MACLLLACLMGARRLQAGGEWQFAAADANRDGYDDLAVIGGGEWYVWMSGAQYVMQGPYDLDLSGGQFAAGDMDGDRQADLAMLSGANWHVWRSGNAFAREGPYNCGVTGTPCLHDFDGDGCDDPCVVAAHTWHVWQSSGITPKMLLFGFDPGASTGPILAWKETGGDYFTCARTALCASPLPAPSHRRPFRLAGMATRLSATSTTTKNRTWQSQ